MRTILLMLTLTLPVVDRGQWGDVDPTTREWFKGLRAPASAVPCCDMTDGRETEYDIRGLHYWVPLDGVWTEVPDDRVVTGANRVGRAILWMQAGGGAIRCFMPAGGV